MKQYDKTLKTDIKIHFRTKKKKNNNVSVNKKCFIDMRYLLCKYKYKKNNIH